jgi:replicative DNA helicase
VLGARPSVGKSALALLLALEAARRCEGTGGCVLYLSLEMPRRDLAARAGVLLGSDGSAPPLSLQRVRDRALRDAEVHRYGRALGAVARLPLLVVDRRDLRPSAVRGLALRAAAQHGRVSLVVVDYLQLLRAEVRSDSREREVAEVSRALQALAGELGCPVLALSQLNRKAAEKERRPTMADLRESGAIEQDADVILLLHREEGDRARPVLLVEKQRNGLAPQELPLGWIAEAARFADAGAMGGIDVAEDAWSA